MTFLSSSTETTYFPNEKSEGFSEPAGFPVVKPIKLGVWRGQCRCLGHADHIRIGAVLSPAPNTKIQEELYAKFESFDIPTSSAVRASNHLGPEEACDLALKAYQFNLMTQLELESQPLVTWSASDYEHADRRSRQQDCENKLCSSLSPRSPLTQAESTILIRVAQRRCSTHRSHTRIHSFTSIPDGLPQMTYGEVRKAASFSLIKDPAREAIWRQILQSSDRDQGLRTAEEHLIANVTATLCRYDHRDWVVGVMDVNALENALKYLATDECPGDSNCSFSLGRAGLP